MHSMTGHPRAIIESRLPHVAVSIISVQVGAAIATTVFVQVGAAGTVLLRQAFAALVLLVIARPAVRGRSTADWLHIVLFGLTFAAMNLCFYEAIDRLPLGIAVTIELLGPLGLAAVLSRSARHLGCVILATIGVLVLGRGIGGTGHVDLTGVLFDLAAAAGWATYIVLNRRVGARVSGTDGLALAMAIAAVTITPIGVHAGGRALLHPAVLGAGFAVAMLSAALPFTLEMHALRAVPPVTFGVLMSLSPAVAATVGWLFLGEHLGLGQVVAIGCVVAASVAATTGSGPGERVDPAGVDVTDQDSPAVPGRGSIGSASTSRPHSLIDCTAGVSGATVTDHRSGA